MGNLTTTKQTEIIELPTFEDISIQDACEMWKQADRDEQRALKLIQEASMYNKGQAVYIIQSKCEAEGTSWIKTCKAELGIDARTAERQVEVFSSKTFLDELKQNLIRHDGVDMSAQGLLKVESLSLPESYNHLNNLNGMNKADEKNIRKDLGKKGLPQDEINARVKVADILTKAENFRQEQQAELMEQLEAYDLKIVDGEVVKRKATNKKVTTPDTTEPYAKTIKALQKRVSELYTSSMKDYGQIINNNHKREQFFADHGWTAEDAASHRKFASIQGSKKLIDNMVEVVLELAPEWNKQYRKLSKLVHPDHGGDSDIQAVINAINSAMRLAEDRNKSFEVESKWREINKDYIAFAKDATTEIALQMSDIIHDIAKNGEVI